MPTHPTARYGWQVPLGTDAVSNGDDLLRAWADALDAAVATADRGTLALRPTSTAGSPGKFGRFYQVTDDQANAQRLDFDYGTGWATLNAFAVDAAANVGSLRTLGAGALQATSGADARLSDQRTPLDASVTLAKVAAALLPSQGASNNTEALRSIGTGPGQVMAGNVTRTFQTPHTFQVPGDVAVAVGDQDVILPMRIPVAAGQSVKVARVEYRLGNGAAGTTVSFKLQSGGADIAGFGTTAAPLVTPSSSGWGETNPADVAVVDLADLVPVVTGVAGSPKNLSVTVVLEHTV